MRAGGRRSKAVIVQQCEAIREYSFVVPVTKEQLSLEVSVRVYEEIVLSLRVAEREVRISDVLRREEAEIIGGPTARNRVDRL